MKQEFVEEMRYLSKLRHPCVTTVMGKSAPVLQLLQMKHKSNIIFIIFVGAVIGKGLEPMLVMEYSEFHLFWDLFHFTLASTDALFSPYQWTMALCTTCCTMKL